MLTDCYVKGKFIYFKDKNMVKLNILSQCKENFRKDVSKNERRNVKKKKMKEEMFVKKCLGRS